MKLMWFHLGLSSGNRRNMEGVSRRNFLAGAGMAAAACATRPLFGMASASKSPFKIAVISDEISQDFDHACSVIANDFGLQWVELREMWGKNLQASSDAEIAEAQKILAKTTCRSPTSQAHCSR